MIRLKDRLQLEQLSCQLLYSYNFIDESFEGWERRKGFANWRIELLDYIMQARLEELNFISNYLSREDTRVYLEFINLASEYCMEPREPMVKTRKVNGIMNYIKYLIKPKKQNNTKVAK